MLYSHTNTFCMVSYKKTILNFLNYVKPTEKLQGDKLNNNNIADTFKVSNKFIL